MSQATEIHVCSYNIHKGFSPTNLRFLLDEIRLAIRKVDADVVFLQEIMGEDRHRRRQTNQLEFLADSIWHHHAYGKNAIYESGHHGNAILSKYPFVAWQNTDISLWSFSQRGILLGKTGNGIHLCCLHFGLFAIEREAQLRALASLLAEHVPESAPLIIAGDFNDWTQSIDRKICKLLQVNEAFREVHGKPARTFPSFYPLLQVDRIYYRNLTLKNAHILSGEPWTRLSDHCALSATFSTAKTPSKKRK
jgi:endonuclease/exonuclease/phosphatase family metal-dependent hydrolase